MITINVNGQQQKLDLPNDMPLLWALRDVLGMTGTKFGCGLGLCGACTVHVDGDPIRSCIMPLSAVNGKSITTIEGVDKTPTGAAVQRAWLASEVPQCGYCQPGQMMSAAALLARFPHPSDLEIDVEMSGNVCRCGTYARIREAIKRAAESKA
jgi:isoquinoline 1-oxidoreductase subunit alpha